MNFLEARWGFQLLGEEGIGRRIAEIADAEDSAMARAKKALGG